MKYKLKSIVGAATVAVALTRTAHAIPITGNIGFSGAAQLNSSSASTATEVVSWGSNTVGSDSGSFASFASIGDAVVLASPWLFNSGAIANFWSVDGFTFNLSSSSVYSNAGGFVNVILAGIVTGNGFDATAFSGSFQVANPPADGVTEFTERLSFNAVPDGGSTVGLLGAACLGMVLIKRKTNQAAAQPGSSISA